MRLSEVENPYGDLEELKRRLSGTDVIPIANAGYLEGQWALGSLERLGAGKITRKHLRDGTKIFGFIYFTSIGDQPITAPIQVGDRILNPGDRFEDDY